MIKNTNKPYIMFALMLLTNAFSFLTNLILARHATPELYGEYSLALRIVMIISMISLLGTQTSSKIFLHRFLENEHTKKGATFFRSYIHWNLNFISWPFLLSIIIGVIAFLPATFFHFIDIKDFFTYNIAYHMLWLAPFAAIAILFSNYIQCKDLPVTAYILSQPLRVGLYFLSAVTLVYILQLQLNAKVLTISYIVVTFCIFGVNFVFAKHKIPEIFELMTPKFLKEPYKVSDEWRQKAFHLSINIMLFLIICSTDLIIIKLIASNKGDVGFYTACSTISMIIWIISQAMYMPISPTIREVFESNSHLKSLEKLLTKSAQRTLLISLVLVVTLIFLSDDILALFGPTYTQYKTTLFVLCLSALIGNSAMSAYYVLLYNKQTKTLMNVCFIEFTTLVVLAIPLTYLFGITGTAAATTLSISTKVVYLFYHARKVVPIKIFWFV